MSSPEESSASSKEDKAESSSEPEQEDGVEEAEGEEQIQCDICEAVIEADAVRFHCEECEVRPLDCNLSHPQGLRCMWRLLLRRGGP